MDKANVRESKHEQATVVWTRESKKQEHISRMVLRMEPVVREVQVKEGWMDSAKIRINIEKVGFKVDDAMGRESWRNDNCYITKR